MIVAALVIGWLSMLWLDSWTRHGDTISVPAVRTLAYNKAMDILNAEGLKGIVADSVYDNHTAPGTVIEQPKGRDYCERRTRGIPHHTCLLPQDGHSTVTDRHITKAGTFYS